MIHPVTSQKAAPGRVRAFPAVIPYCFGQMTGNSMALPVVGLHWAGNLFCGAAQPARWVANASGAA